jgi:hypothetical protein
MRAAKDADRFWHFLQLVRIPRRHAKPHLLLDFGHLIHR